MLLFFLIISIFSLCNQDILRMHWEIYCLCRRGFRLQRFRYWNNGGFEVDQPADLEFWLPAWCNQTQKNMFFFLIFFHIFFVLFAFFYLICHFCLLLSQQRDSQTHATKLFLYFNLFILRLTFQWCVRLLDF